jgi:hypothetical protein
VPGIVSLGIDSRKALLLLGKALRFLLCKKEGNGCIKISLYYMLELVVFVFVRYSSVFLAILSENLYFCGTNK